MEAALSDSVDSFSSNRFTTQVTGCIFVWIGKVRVDWSRQVPPQGRVLGLEIGALSSALSLQNKF